MINLKLIFLSIRMISTRNPMKNKTSSLFPPLGMNDESTYLTLSMARLDNG